ncbi:hypothetical protein C8R45DRAFT_936946 [Mycena sanguinolenta]|nr:hypothetical protein C8R45DRAFT_936946 [Mycena sanguinolenta]
MPVPSYSEGELARNLGVRHLTSLSQTQAARDQHVAGNSGSLDKSGEQARHKLANHPHPWQPTTGILWPNDRSGVKRCSIQGLPFVHWDNPGNRRSLSGPYRVILPTSPVTPKPSPSQAQSRCNSAHQNERKNESTRRHTNYCRDWAEAETGDADARNEIGMAADTGWTNKHHYTKGEGGKGREKKRHATHARMGKTRKDREPTRGAKKKQMDGENLKGNEHGEGRTSRGMNTEKAGLAGE